MSYIERAFIAPERQSFFLFGPRGTGKSLYLREAFPRARRIDLLNPRTLAHYAAHPETLLEEWNAAGQPRDLVVDEVQRLPTLLDVVHEMMETVDNCPRFILTGSSSRKLKRAGVNLLGGRALKRSLHPFLPSELGEAFELGRALSHGLLPLVNFSVDPPETLSAYKGLYLVEEVQQEGIVRDIAPFARFLEAISYSHGALLEISNVARECRVPRKTVEGYVAVLQDLLLGYRLPVFAKRPGRKTVASSKFFIFDCGVYRSLRPRGPLSIGDAEGPALEGLVLQTLRAWADYRASAGTENDLYFWRTTGGAEVDFIVYGDEGLVALEVKNAMSIKPKDLRGLKAFLDDFGVAKAVLLYRGDIALAKGNVLCLPVESFLRALAPDRSIEEVMDACRK